MGRRAAIFRLIPLLRVVLQTSYCTGCTHSLFKDVLQSGLGMGMGMNGAAQEKWKMTARGVFRTLAPASDTRRSTRMAFTAFAYAVDV